MKKSWLYFILLLLNNYFYSQEKSVTIPLIYEPIRVSNLPSLGIGHYINENYSNGIMFSLLEGVPYYFSKTIGNRFTNDKVKYSLQSNDSIIYKSGMIIGTSPEDFYLNRLKSYFYNLNYNIMGIDEFISYRNLRKDELHTIPLSNVNIWDLSISPFKWKYLRDPEVFVPILIDAGFNIFFSYKEPRLWEVKKINFFGKEINPEIATAGNLLLEFVLINLVAISEEMIFRGILQTELSERVNKDFGLIASSILFGLAHYKSGLAYSIRAGIGGLYFGWQYQKYHYDLGRVIALHFHIDFTPTLVNSLLNPLGLLFNYSITK